VTLEWALGYLTDPVADALEKEFIVTRNEAVAEARTIDESVVLCIRSDFDEDRKAQNEVVGTVHSSDRKGMENMPAVAKGYDAMSVDSKRDVEES
jgi:hypothetical protein